MTSTEIALLLNDNAEQIIRIGEIIGKKIPERDDFSNLNEFEKTFIYIDILEQGITNGGFIQFFFSSSGQFTHEIFHAYMAIKAEKTIDILTKAIHLFPQMPVPKNLRTRQAILMQKESNIDLWDELDTEFYKYEDDILKLTLDYVRKNITHFD
ncbi:DMP19 family protein [Polaribacter sp. PL03]|uniref:DMP19 family protein n=1 Tax=Polaribacter sp. PL03 TaxID=3088353 RepID=UPI0029CDDE43|nr:DMP19 family protein [Polaribacter sp. PL03]MDX6747582.1 DMP19 family protein [Polaribacter sp. PL03]